MSCLFIFLYCAQVFLQVSHTVWSVTFGSWRPYILRTILTLWLNQHMHVFPVFVTTAHAVIVNTCIIFIITHTRRTESEINREDNLVKNLVLCICLTCLYLGFLEQCNIACWKQKFNNELTLMTCYMLHDLYMLWYWIHTPPIHVKDKRLL